MGTRYFLKVACPKCGLRDDDVYYAPTCGFTVWRCSVCETVVDLKEYTGISYEEASNVAEIATMCDQSWVPPDAVGDAPRA